MATTKTSSTDSLGIGEVAERTGLSVHALRFYEREGLLVGPVHRDSGGRRRYSPSDVDWLGICVRLRESGMPLAELKRFAELVREGTGNEPERLRLLDAHRCRVEDRISALEECRSVIVRKVAVYAEHVARGTAAGLWDPTAAVDGEASSSEA
ncbi:MULTISPECIES: MerR family transcriptional regulator [unclassified Streptomyces]|uniref:MerR family transcriptional regulator n=1 Tax=unclassified Streptomyces TaxID=2593676 RepID=UPI002ED2525D|nr:MerR family transcriptional regulator [Streptomyces sp. NBC_00891]WSY05640.1 MerR family transcriptional regulator [Streptomyces sp. NBC_00890]WSZ07264.1 MerR family transcriptional regulator [Streptomyces sp. NBC_00869]WSZ25237.1 MerR family transcriptional regulator [Streptomyces sp. NBC_00870]